MDTRITRSRIFAGMPHLWVDDLNLRLIQLWRRRRDLRHRLFPCSLVRHLVGREEGQESASCPIPRKNCTEMPAGSARQCPFRGWTWGPTGFGAESPCSSSRHRSRRPDRAPRPSRVEALTCFGCPRNGQSAGAQSKGCSSPSRVTVKSRLAV